MIRIGTNKSPASPDDLFSVDLAWPGVEDGSAPSEAKTNTISARGEKDPNSVALERVEVELRALRDEIRRLRRQVDRLVPGEPARSD